MIITIKVIRVSKNNKGLGKHNTSDDDMDLRSEIDDPDEEAKNDVGSCHSTFPIHSPPGIKIVDEAEKIPPFPIDEEAENDVGLCHSTFPIHSLPGIEIVDEADKIPPLAIDDDYFPSDASESGSDDDDTEEEESDEDVIDDGDGGSKVNHELQFGGTDHKIVFSNAVKEAFGTRTQIEDEQSR